VRAVHIAPLAAFDGRGATLRRGACGSLTCLFRLAKFPFIATSDVLSGVYGAQELNDLVVDLGRGFVLNPVTHIVEFESSQETRKANTELFYGGIESRQTIRLPRNVKGRLGDLRAFPSTRQIEIRFGGAVVVQATVKAGTLELSDVMSDVIWFCP